MNKMVIIEKYKQAVVEMFRQSIIDNYIDLLTIKKRLKYITESVNDKYKEFISDYYIYWNVNKSKATLCFELSDGFKGEYEFKF